MTGPKQITNWIMLFSLIKEYSAVDSMYVKQGSNVVLQCPYKPVIYWSNPETKEMLTIGLDINKYLDIYSRLSITVNFDLIILNFTSTDLQIYRCTSQQGKQQLQSFDLKPLLAQSPSNMKINGKFEASFLYADEGIAFTLTCSVVSGKPEETLEWTNNYRTLSLGGPGNISYSFIPDDSNGGEHYTCSARNLATDYPLSRSIQLFVNLRPRVSLHADPSPNVNEGQKLTIICNCNSTLLHETVIWFKKPDASSNYSEPILNRSLVLFVEKATKEHIGQYTCQVTNRLGTDQSQINITVNYPPTIHEREPIYDINGTLGKLIPIKIDIDCFPSSIVSWAHTAGGKLGTWTTTPHLSISSHFRQTFQLKSTVLPTKQDHFGLYNVIVKNSAGSLELIIRLHLNETRVNFSPHPLVCLTTDSVELKCNISNDETMKWKIDWEHYFNGVYIQTLHGITDRHNAILEITFCDFRDNGQYICVWSSDTKKLSGSSLLTVYGLLGEVTTIEQRKPEMFNVVIGSMYHAVPGMIILFLCIAILACNAQKRSCSRHRYELRFSESTEQSQSRGEVQNEAIYEEIENYRIAEENSSEMPDCSGRSNSMFSENDDTTSEDTYDDKRSFYQMVDWRNSIVDSEESQSEKYSVDGNVNTSNKNCVVESESSICFQLQMPLSQNEKVQNVCYSDGQKDIMKTYCNDSSDITDHSHIYFTVLPDV